MYGSISITSLGIAALVLFIVYMVFLLVEKYPLTKHTIFGFIAGLALCSTYYFSSCYTPIKYLELGKATDFNEGYYKRCFGHLKTDKPYRDGQAVIKKVNLILKADKSSIDILSMQCSSYDHEFEAERIKEATDIDMSSLSQIEQIYYIAAVKSFIKEQESFTRVYSSDGTYKVRHPDGTENVYKSSRK